MTDTAAEDQPSEEGHLHDEADGDVRGETRGPRANALRRGFALLPRALPYLRPYKRHSVSSIAVTGLLAAAALAEPWPLAFVIDTVLGDRPAPSWVSGLIGEEAGPLILLAVGAALLITLVTGGLTVVNQYLTTTVDQKMGLDFRSDLFQHVQRLSLTFHDDQRTGDLMYRLNNQAGALGQLVVSIPTLVQSLLTVLGMAWVVLRIDPHLAALALLVLPFMYYSTIYYANRVEPQLRRVRGLEGANLSIVHEAMAMLRVVVAFGRERHEFERFRSQGERAIGARVSLTVRQTLFRLAVSFITACGTAAVLGVGARGVLQGRLSPGQLLVVMSYIASVYQPLEQMTNFVTGAQQQFIMFEHALSLLDEAPGVTEKEDAVAIERANGEIAFEDVRFSYAQRPETLKDLTFRVPAGSVVAVVGPTGAGKSTLASLLPRFYDVEAGRILLDGIDVRDVTLESLRAQFSVVLQEPLLFSGSIADNIRYGRPDATNEEVRRAAKAANAHDFIRALPRRYQTQLGERGAKISGGERQRISVARAFLRDAPVLILDEPTSSIDSRTEGVVLQALERLMEGRTTLMIAHRLSTVRRADQILVLHHGELVQRGTHDELVATEGLYHELWAAQSGQGELPAGEAQPPPSPVPSEEVVAPLPRGRDRACGNRSGSGADGNPDISNGKHAERGQPAHPGDGGGPCQSADDVLAVLAHLIGQAESATKNGHGLPRGRPVHEQTPRAPR